MLSPEELAQLIPAESAVFRSPIPTRSVASDEFMPAPQTAKQREFELRCKNVYGDLGQVFAQSTVAQPRLCAAMLGQLAKGLGSDHVVWGTDAVWTGSPSGRSRPCGGWKSRKACSAATASHRSAPRTGP